MPLDDLTEEQDSLWSSDGPQKHDWNLDIEKRQILDVLGKRGHFVWHSYSTNSTQLQHRRRVKRLSPSRPEP